MKFGGSTFFLVMVACGSLASSAEPAYPEATVADIQALLDANGTRDVGAQVGPIAAQQMSVALHRADPTLPERADAVVMDVVVNYVRQQAEHDRVADRLVPIYGKYLTRDDVLRLTEFYRSPVGRKLVSVMPAVTLESARVGQEWMESILPGLQSQLLSRLKSEKLIE